MEYKFLRLYPEQDYARIIAALKGYQLASRGRPITIARQGQPELPEQLFMREWAAHPEPAGDQGINRFLAKVEQGMMLEFNSRSCDKRSKKLLENIYTMLKERDEYVRRG